ncbi:MAG: hypothetical protein HY340_03950 [Candidatus Kerfeldbacteria bacterium]|nr:hypothetical protein [Candidatus Kerfeldbacteria bacterium]
MLPQQQIRLLMLFVLVSLACTEAKTEPAVPVIDFGGTPLRVQSNLELTTDERAWLFLASRERHVTVPQGATLFVRMSPLKEVAGYWRVDLHLAGANGDTLMREDAIGCGRTGAYDHAVGFLVNYLAWKTTGAHN